MKATPSEFKDPFEGLMVKIEGGTYQMGDTFGNGGENEIPVRRVTLSDFLMCKYPVTQGQWSQIMDENTNPSWFKGNEQLPVEMVDWESANQFIKRLNILTGKNYRLPSEAEWEYAAKGGRLAKQCWFSGDNQLENVGWYIGNSNKTTHPVGKLAANELGLFDMSGNVWEWCIDWEGNYSAADQTNPFGPDSGVYHVIRGGSWASIPKGCRPSCRHGQVPGPRANDVGFRLVHLDF